MKFLFLLFLTLFFTGQAANAQAKPYSIKTIKAFLYYNEEGHDKPSVRGTLSENLIDNKEFALWNTIIGEGSAKAASNQTFVVVELTGNPKDLVERQVVLTVTAEGKQIFKQTQSFSIADEGKNYSAAFLLYNTGCQPLKLKAEIVHQTTRSGKKQSVTESSLVKSIPFACGE